jgi:hypothetical protein
VIGGTRTSNQGVNIPVITDGQEPGVERDAKPLTSRSLGPVVALAIVAGNVVFWATFQRAFHPFELEWMEGGSLQHLNRVIQGLPLYPAPSIDFVPFPYPPFYYYLALPFAKLTGASLLTLRLVSQLATLASCLAIFAIVRHESRRWDLGVVCAGLFVATYRVSGAYMDVGRIDSVFVALVLAGIYFLRTRDDVLGLVVAGGFAFLATFTKQTGLAIFGPMMLWCLYRDASTFSTSKAALDPGFRFRRTLLFSGTTLGLTVASAAVLGSGEENHFFFYVLGAQSGHEIRWSLLPYFLWNDLIWALPFAVGTVGVWVWRSKDRLSVLFYLAFFVGIAAAWIVPRAKVGGAMNNLIPLHACLVVLLGVALSDLLRSEAHRAWVPRAAAVGLAMQILWLAFDPRIALPRPGDVERGVRFVKQLADAKGEVLIPAHGYLAGLAGKRVYAHQMPVDDLSRSGLPGAASVRDEFARAIADRRFGLIVDSTSRFLEHYPNDHVLAEHYRKVGPVFETEGQLTPRSGWQVAPGVVWVPRVE